MGGIQVWAWVRDGTGTCQVACVVDKFSLGRVSQGQSGFLWLFTNSPASPRIRSISPRSDCILSRASLVKDVPNIVKYDKCPGTPVRGHCLWIWNSLSTCLHTVFAYHITSNLTPAQIAQYSLITVFIIGNLFRGPKG